MSEQSACAVGNQNNKANIFFSQKRLIFVVHVKCTHQRSNKQNFSSESSSAKLIQRNFFSEKLLQPDSADMGAGKFPLTSMGG